MILIAPLLLTLADAPLHATASSIESVVVYPAGARVSRRATLQLPAGTARIRMDNLGSTAEVESARARIEGARLVAMEPGRESAVDPESTSQAAALDAAIRANEDEAAMLAGRMAAIEVETKLVDSVSVRAASDATRDGGTATLDLGALDKQAEWIRNRRLELAKQQIEIRRSSELLARQRQTLVENRGRLGGSRVHAWLDLVVDVPAEGMVGCVVEVPTIHAHWNPVYSVRGDTSSAQATIEYEAVIVQDTGENWPAVPMTLSTAQVAGAMAPPAIEPWFVQVQVERPVPPSSRMRADLSAVVGSVAEDAPSEKLGLMDRRDLSDKGGLFGFQAEAEVRATGPAVVFVLPAPLAVPSNSQSQTKARIADVSASAHYLRQAQPLVDADVYLRGTLTNSSLYQFLPGAVSLFMGGEFVGTTRFTETIPPGQEFDLFLGVDRSVHSSRELVLKNDSQTGLFGGGRSIHYDFRVRIVNGNATPIEVELFDRRPVSQNEKIEIAASKLLPPLATDKRYTEDLAPAGILKWLLTVPPTPAGESGFPVTWSVDVSHSKDIRITGLPE
ncbi:MAG: mucoidy inhibitor MuiA family protein [Phycisphaerales bacterium]|nr:mucoidy inhibitor MuiA family protein [Phycisphaerales bacterium]